MAQKFEPRNDVRIEGNVAKWSISKNGAINGLYTGEFTFRCVLSPSQQIAADREYRDLLGPNPTLAEERITFMAYALSQLKQRILDAPPFWSSTESGIPGDIPDEEILTEILDAAVHAQLKYRHEINERKVSQLKKAAEAAQKILDGKSDEEDDDLDLDEDEG